jgi:hypothetical protein
MQGSALQICKPSGKLLKFHTVFARLLAQFYDKTIYIELFGSKGENSPASATKIPTHSSATTEELMNADKGYDLPPNGAFLQTHPTSLK